MKQWDVVLFSVILSLIYFSSCQYQSRISKFSFGEACGRISEIPGDPRTLVPWNVAIFLNHTGSSPNSQPKFINSGVLISPSAVLTVFRGFYGAAMGKKKRYFIPQPENYIVAVGLSSTNFSSADQFTQFSQVNYIHPYSQHEEENREFHFWLYHLKEPFNLETPFARVPCLPFFLRGLPSSWQLMHGGFVHQPKTSKELFQVRAYNATALVEEECAQIFQRHYGGDSSDYVWCSTVSGIPGNSESENGCLRHGSAVVAHLLQRWFLAGLTAMIPDKRNGDSDCGETTIYIQAKTQSHFPWLLHNIQCGSNHFPCVNATCIPLSQVCNRIQDCPDEDLSDEDPIFCTAQSRCRIGEASIECNMKAGKCLKLNQLCDNIKDCEGGSDENVELCQLPESQRSPGVGGTINGSAHLFTDDESPATDYRAPPGILRVSSKNGQNLETNASRNCFPIAVSEGTKLTCFHPTTNKTVNCAENTGEGTIARLSCDVYYSAKFRIPSTTRKCMPDGRWYPYRPFTCEPNCGILNSDVTALITNAQSTSRKTAFPWYAAIFRENLQGQHNFLCGGSLIENRVVVTAAHCVEEVAKLPHLSSKYKIILAPVSSNYEDNLRDNLAKIFNVKQARIPPSYNFRTLASDIAIVELLETVIFESNIRPVCYLQSLPPAENMVGQYGKVAGFGYDEDGKVSEILKWTNFPVVSKTNCVQSINASLPLSTFCAGFRNGTSLCYGDSGGGIVFQDTGGNYMRYTLKGVVSAEASWGTQTRTCQTGSFSIFTYVDAFRQWILETLENIDI